MDGVLSDRNDSRRDLVVSRTSSVVRLSQQDHDGRSIVQFGKVIHFFVYKFRDTERMLAYIQIYNVADFSQRSKILRLTKEGSKEIVDVSAIEEGIEIMKDSGMSYLLVRRRMSEKKD